MRALRRLSPVVLLLLAACGGDGVGVKNYADSSQTPPNQSPLLNDDEAAGSGSDPITGQEDGDIRDVRLQNLDFTVSQPSVLSVLFRAVDGKSRPVTGLTDAHLQILENAQPIDPQESFVALWGQQMWNYSFNTVVMIDVSASISDSSLQSVREATRLLWQDESAQARDVSQQRFALYGFDDSPQISRDFSASVPSLNTGLNEVQKRGISSTDLYGAVVEGSSRWDPVLTVDKVSLGALLIITDGRDTAGRYSLAQAQEAVGNERPVYVINLNSAENAESLQRLATGGYFAANSEAELKTAVEQVRQQMNRIADSYYLLRYASPKRASIDGESASNHQFTVSIRDNRFSGSAAKISESFNSANFYDVSPEVLVSAPSEVALSSNPYISVSAATGWARQRSVYEWQVSSAAGACGYADGGGLSGDRLQLRLYASGICQVTVTDATNGPSTRTKVIRVY